jgi:Cu-Zn family superoxide dismutase
MFKELTLLLCLAICAAAGNHTHHGFWKNGKTRIVYPIHAQAVMFGHVWNPEIQNFSRICGTVKFAQQGFDVPVDVTVNITVKPVFDIGKTHGIHIHEFGTVWSKNTTVRCAATGPHYNPKNVSHGFRESEVRHVGDLGNIEMGANGTFFSTFSDKYLHLAGFESIIGRGVVFHEKMDDGGLTGLPLSNTTGAAGSRIACGDIVYVMKW